MCHHPLFLHQLLGTAEKANTFSLPIPGTMVRGWELVSLAQNTKGRGFAGHLLVPFTAGKAEATRYLVVWVQFLVLTHVKTC